MAKFGEKPTAYDPFSEISNSLATLSAQPKEEEAPSQSVETEEETATPEIQELSPVESARPKPLVRKPQVPRPVEQESPTPSRTVQPRQPQAQQRLSSGGGRSNLGTAPASVAPELALSATKRFKTTKHEAQRIDQATLRLAAHLGFSVDLSKITRALWDVYLRFEDDILRSLPDEAPTKRPANYDAVGLAELDERLSEMVGEGLMLACMRHRKERQL